MKLFRVTIKRTTVGRFQLTNESFVTVSENEEAARAKIVDRVKGYFNVENIRPVKHGAYLVSETYVE